MRGEFGRYLKIRISLLIIIINWEQKSKSNLILLKDAQYYLISISTCHSMDRTMLGERKIDFFQSLTDKIVRDLKCKMLWFDIRIHWGRISPSSLKLINTSITSRTYLFEDGVVRTEHLSSTLSADFNHNTQSSAVVTMLYIIPLGLIHLVTENLYILSILISPSPSLYQPHFYLMYLWVWLFF